MVAYKRTCNQVNTEMKSFWFLRPKSIQSFRQIPLFTGLPNLGEDLSSFVQEICGAWRNTKEWIQRIQVHSAIRGHLLLDGAGLWRSEPRAMEMYESHQQSEHQLPWALPCFLPQCCMLLFSERRLRAWAFFEVDRRAKYQYYTTCMPLPTGSSGLLSWLKIVCFFRVCLKIPSQIQGLLLQISSNQLNPGDVVRVPWFLHRCSVHRWIPRFMVPLGTISRFPQFVFFWNTNLQTRNLPEKSTSLLHGEFLIHPSFTGHFSPKKGWSSIDSAFPRSFEAALLSLYESWESQGWGMPVCI